MMVSLLIVFLFTSSLVKATPVTLAKECEDNKIPFTVVNNELYL